MCKHKHLNLGFLFVSGSICDMFSNICMSIHIYIYTYKHVLVYACMYIYI